MTGPQASIYGTRASGGVVLIYTRSGIDSTHITRKEGQIIVQGFQPVIDFKTYRNEISKKFKKKSSIVYWNAKLMTDDNGEVIIKLPSISDYKGLCVEVSTITRDGKVGWSSSKF